MQETFLILMTISKVGGKRRCAVNNGAVSLPINSLLTRGK